MMTLQIILSLLQKVITQKLSKEKRYFLIGKEKVLLVMLVLCTLKERYYYF
jgi:hypothetical protein